MAKLAFLYSVFNRQVGCSAFRLPANHHSGTVIELCCWTCRPIFAQPSNHSAFSYTFRRNPVPSLLRTANAHPIMRSVISLSTSLSLRLLPDFPNPAIRYLFLSLIPSIIPWFYALFSQSCEIFYFVAALRRFLPHIENHHVRDFLRPLRELRQVEEFRRRRAACRTPASRPFRDSGIGRRNREYGRGPGLVRGAAGADGRPTSAEATAYCKSVSFGTGVVSPLRMASISGRLSRLSIKAFTSMPAVGPTQACRPPSSRSGYCVNFCSARWANSNERGVGRRPGCAPDRSRTAARGGSAGRR